MSTSTRTFFRPNEGPVDFRLNAPSAQVKVSTSPNLTEAAVAINGPAEVVDRAKEKIFGGSWIITLPEDAGTTVVTRTGNSTSLSVNNVSSGTVIVGGNVTINGRQVSGGTMTNPEPTIVTVVLPEGSDLRTRVDNGSVNASGTYTVVDHQASNASLYVQAAHRVEAETSNGNVVIDRAGEEIDVHTSNGKVRVGASAPFTDVRTSNGSVEVDASGDHQISARTSNGSVTVYRNGHNPKVQTRTSNGRERVL